MTEDLVKSKQAVMSENANGLMCSSANLEYKMCSRIWML